MSHKSGHIIINSMVGEGEDGEKKVACLSSDQVERLKDIRARDEYSGIDRLYLGMLVASIADDPVD